MCLLDSGRNCVYRVTRVTCVRACVRVRTRAGTRAAPATRVRRVYSCVGVRVCVCVRAIVPHRDRCSSPCRARSAV